MLSLFFTIHSNTHILSSHFYLLFLYLHHFSANFSLFLYFASHNFLWMLFLYYLFYFDNLNQQYFCTIILDPLTFIDCSHMHTLILYIHFYFPNLYLHCFLIVSAWFHIYYLYMLLYMLFIHFVIIHLNLHFV